MPCQTVLLHATNKQLVVPREWRYFRSALDEIYNDSNNVTVEING